VAREEKGDARVSFRLGDPCGPLLGDVVVPSTGDRYEYAQVTAGLQIPPTSPVTDLYLVLDGALRLDWFRLDPAR
jgi:beta-glucosidase